MKFISFFTLTILCCSFTIEDNYFISQTFQVPADRSLVVDLPGEVEIIKWSHNYVSVETQVSNIPSTLVWNIFKGECKVDGIGVFDEYRIEKKKELLIFENGKVIVPQYKYYLYVPFYAQIGSICEESTAYVY